jgi:hypothetical protein
MSQMGGAAALDNMRWTMEAGQLNGQYLMSSVTPQALTRTVPDCLSQAAGAVVPENGVVVFDLAQPRYSKRRLAVVELKADEDIHLPLEGLDYWSRVEWHNARGELLRFGYFGGTELTSEKPLLFLVAPALHVHPATDTLLRYFAPETEWEFAGIDERWRGKKVAFRKWPDRNENVDPRYPTEKPADFCLCSTKPCHESFQAPSRRRTSTNCAR